MPHPFAPPSKLLSAPPFPIAVRIFLRAAKAGLLHPLTEGEPKTKGISISRPRRQMSSERIAAGCPLGAGGEPCGRPVPAQPKQVHS